MAKKWNFDPFKGYKGNLDWLEKRTIFVTVHGSQAYGTSMPESDIDVKGLAIPPKEYFHGFVKNFEQAEGKEPYDMVIYGLRKFMKLASNCNPNIIEVLFTDPDDWVVDTVIFRKLWEHRDLFLSKKARFTFSGYANQQLKRIKGHKRWLLEPPTHKPTREEFGLPVERKMSQSEIGATQKLVDDGAPLAEDIMRLFHKEQKYYSARREWEQYQKWKRTRNEKRAKLEADFGYDCYLDDTEFLTERGWLPYEQITKADKLATVRQKTGELEFQKFSERVRKPYSGEILHFETQDSLCSVTPNHRMLVSPMCRSRKNGFSTRYRQQTAKWQIKRADELLNEYKSHYHIRLTAHQTKDNTEISENLLWIVGTYVSEGCVGKRLKNGAPSVLRFSQKESNRQQVFLDSLCESTEMRKITHFREDKGYNELIYTLADRSLAKQVVEWCGEYSRNKRLPPWITTLSSQQANSLLNVMIAGDGTERKYSSIYYTISQALANDVQTLGVIAGRPTKIWGPYEDGMYQVYLGDPEATDSLVATKYGHVTSEEVVDRHIVCFTVPNEILITRRKGKLAIQGNTKHAGHLVRLMRMCREILSEGKVYVRRPDADELMAIRKGAWTYDELIEWADKQDKEMQKLYETSPLPEKPQVEKIDKVCQMLVEEALRHESLRF